MGGGFFVSDWAVPIQSPQTHTAALGGVAICSPDSSLPVEIMRNLQPGACPKSAEGVYVMNGSRAQDKHVINNNKIIYYRE